MRRARTGDLDVALRRRILFFGGKGGVGKTTLAAATALRSAEAGDSTLLVSTDPAHSTGDILEAELGPEPRTVIPGLEALEIDPVVEADAYIRGVKARVADVTPPRLAGEVERQIDVARVSPGAEEAALFERFARILEEESRYDRIVFDTAPTGQTLRLLSLPELMGAWIGGLVDRRRKVSALGRMWRHVAGAAAATGSKPPDPVLDALEERQRTFLGARRVLTDDRRTAFLFVIVPDRLPILETSRAMTTLTEHGIPVGGLFVNRVLPDGSVGEFLERRRKRQATHLSEIEVRFRSWPSAHVPLLEADPTGLTALREVARHLSSAPGVEAT